LEASVCHTCEVSSLKELEPWRGPEHAERKKGKGKGGKGAPQEIADLDHNTPNGDRICWNFNLKNKSCKYAKAGLSPACNLAYM